MTTCTACGHETEATGSGGLCADCHRIAYGANHLPTAIRALGGGYRPSCHFRCDVIETPLLPHTDRDDAVEESRRLHREAIHGPDWRWSTGRGWFATRAEGI